MNKYFLTFFPFVILCVACDTAIVEDSDLLLHLMQKEPAKFHYVLEHSDSLEVQIMYTQINRDTSGRPTFKSIYFHVDSTNYFYPASTVKLPLVLLALDKVNSLNIRGLDKFTPVFHDSVYAGQRSVRWDSTSENRLPSIAHYAKKILLVSDNDAANCLYEFMGQKGTNDQLHKKGYNILLLHRLSRAASFDQNRHTEVIRFVRNDTLIYKQPMLVNQDSIIPLRKVFKGKGYVKNNQVIHEPFDFTYKNAYPLQEQQEILKAIIFPEAVSPQKRFNLTREDRLFVLQYMSQLPRETLYPSYKSDTGIHDSAGKWLMYAEKRSPIPNNIRIFNKIGGAYGYLIDNAYIVDFENGVEFILSAVINTNLDGIYNDDLYEYKTIGYPFLKNIGQTIYHYELNRKRVRKPDLNEFKLQYEQ